MPQPSPTVQPAMPFPKIAFVRQRFSRFGGGELMLDRTLSALSARGVALSIVAREWEPHEGIEFHRCDPPRVPRGKRDSRFAGAACRIIATIPGTLVQSHERLSCCDIYRAGDGVHAVYLAHRARGMGFFKRLFQTISPYHRDVLTLERAMFASPRLKAVIVNAEMVADEIAAHFNYPRERIHFIPNGIDLGRFDISALQTLRDETRKSLGLRADQKCLVIVGSGYERKGVAQAIQALAASGTGASMLVIGHEKRVSHYETLASQFGIQQNVRFLGKQTNVLPYLAAADAMILPSIYDPFPSAVLEGLAAGLPVITSESCGARDVVRELDPALVRDANDIAGLSEAISAALALSDQPDTKERARAIAARFDTESMADLMLRLYEQIAKEMA
jgi:UDP-glucose:(heptosyl)LPS alpha-1,3-glucosyltransferase